MASGAYRLAFLATKGFPESGVRAAMGALEDLGFEVDLLDISAASPAIVPRYSGLALPAIRRRTSNPLLTPLIESMHAAGKPVLYVAIPAPGASSGYSKAGFQWKRMFGDA